MFIFRGSSSCGDFKGKSLPSLNDYWGKHHALITSVDKPSRAIVVPYPTPPTPPHPQLYPTLAPASAPTLPYPSPAPTLSYPTLPYPTPTPYPYPNTLPKRSQPQTLTLTLPLPYPREVRWPSDRASYSRARSRGSILTQVAVLCP